MKKKIFAIMLISAVFMTLFAGCKIENFGSYQDTLNTKGSRKQFAEEPVNSY